MTCIVGLYYEGGNKAVIVSDSRIMRGTEYSTEQKIFGHTENVVFSASGLTGIARKLMSQIKESIVQLRAMTLSEIVKIIEDETSDLQYRYKNPRQPRFSQDETLVSAIIGGFENSRSVLFNLHENGYAEEIEDFISIGDGSRFANQILKNLYNANITKQRAIEIGVHAIIQVAKLIADVDDNPQIAVLEDNNIKILNIDDDGNFQTSTNEIDNIKRKINGIEKKRSIIFNLLLDGTEEIKRQFDEVIGKYQIETEKK